MAQNVCISILTKAVHFRMLYQVLLMHIQSSYHTFDLFLAADMAERKLSVEEEEAKRIAEMGKPVLGEHPKLEVVIEESYEFKVRKLS